MGLRECEGGVTEHAIASIGAQVVSVGFANVSKTLHERLYAAVIGSKFVMVAEPSRAVKLSLHFLDLRFPPCARHVRPYFAEKH